MNQEKDRDRVRDRAGITRRQFLKVAGAAVVGAVGGFWLPDSSKKTASADGSPQANHNKVFLPIVAKDFREPETPLYLREFGAPDRGVVMRNRIEQGGGNPAYVEMGDQELFNNMLYLRETYGRPDLKLEITFYSSWDLLMRNVKYNPSMPTRALLWDSWAGRTGTFKETGVQVFVYREQDETLEFHISLPEVNPGRIPTEQEIKRMHNGFIDEFTRFTVLTKEDGQTTVPSIDRVMGNDFSSHPRLRFENGEIVGSALWIRMETVPA